MKNNIVKPADYASRFIPLMRDFVLMLCCVLLINVYGCLRKKEKNTNPVARVYNKFLYREDMDGLIKPGTSPEDSLQVVKSFIDNWIKQNVILHKAESNLTEEEKNVSRQLEEYRASLITYAYESALIRQQLDTNVSDSEIEKYYSENPRNFELKENIIKAIYLKVNANAPKLDKLRKWYKSEQSKDKLLFEEYCQQFAVDFNLNDEEWMPFDEMLKKTPIKTYDKEQYLKHHRFIEVADSNYYYFINIKGFMIKESLSPLSFEKENIKSLIINKRKLLLVQEMEQAAWQQAQITNELEIF